MWYNGVITSFDRGSCPVGTYTKEEDWEMKKNSFRFLFMLLLIAIMAATPTTVLAKGSKGPFKDVTRKKVDSESYSAIVYIAKYDGFVGVAKKNRLYPNRYMTRRDFLIVLSNLYGDKVSVSMADLRAANGKVTSKYACDRMVELSRKLGYPIRWNGNKTKLKRKDVARYIKIFATYNPALAPRK